MEAVNNENANPQEQPEIVKYPQELKPSLVYKSFNYTVQTRKQRKSDDSWLATYRCSSFRKTECNAKAYIQVTGCDLYGKSIVQYDNGVVHSCVGKVKNINFSEPQKIDEVIDVTAEMKEVIKERSMENLGTRPNKIAKQVSHVKLWSYVINFIIPIGSRRICRKIFRLTNNNAFDYSARESCCLYPPQRK
jgi:hypothetical protein